MTFTVERSVTLTATVRIKLTRHFHDGESYEQATAEVVEELREKLAELVGDEPSFNPDTYEVVAQNVDSRIWDDGCPDCAEAYAEQRPTRDPLRAASQKVVDMLACQSNPVRDGGSQALVDACYDLARVLDGEDQ